MSTAWSYDESVDAADIDLTAPGGHVRLPVRTVDLLGAHVLLDVDSHGTVVSIEILGPAAHFKLADLRDYLGREPNTHDGRELHALRPHRGPQRLDDRRPRGH